MEMNGIPNQVTGVGSMYKIKPVFTVPDVVNIPNVMYCVKPICPSMEPQPTIVNGPKVKGLVSKETQGGNNDDAMNKLEKRQLKILNQLRSLKEVVSYTHEKCVINKTTKDTISEACMSATSKPADVPVLSSSSENQIMEEDVDVVIMANPEAPPYSLLFFVNLLEQSYKNAVVSVKGHVHSSYNGTVSMDVLSVFNQEREGANFRFTLIWKNVDRSSLIIKPDQSTPIIGESNIAKFLSRMLPKTTSSLNYDSLNQEDLVRVDSLLNLEFEDNVIPLVEKELKLSKGDFLSGTPTIADLILFSAVASKIVKGSKKNAPASVRKWFEKVELAFGFHSGI